MPHDAPTVTERLRRPRRAAFVLAALSLTLLALTAPLTPPAHASEQPLRQTPPVIIDEPDCGPPSEEIPGPPPWQIVVGQPIRESWLRCSIPRDFEGQTYTFDRWGEVRPAFIEGYPLECWTPEAAPDWPGRRTEGLIADVYGWNLDHTQDVRFTYRIQRDGDYINNWRQEIVPAP